MAKVIKSKDRVFVIAMLVQGEVPERLERDERGVVTFVFRHTEGIVEAIRRFEQNELMVPIQAYFTAEQLFKQIIKGGIEYGSDIQS